VYSNQLRRGEPVELPSQTIVRIGDDPLATFCFLLPASKAINRQPIEQETEETTPSTPVVASPSESTQTTKSRKQRKKKIPEQEGSPSEVKSEDVEMDTEVSATT